MRCALQLFARPPIPGRTKTRLSPAVGAEGAAALYAAFIRDTCATVARAGGFDASLWVAGEPDHPALQRHGLPRRAQRGDDLGERMHGALREGLAVADAALVLGTDLPTLPSGHLRRAARALRKADVVLGPAADGGYYLIGVRGRASRSLPVLFSGVRWSSSHVLADTLDLSARAGLRVATVGPWYDVDGPEDLALLRLHLSLDPTLAPATRAALAGCGGF
ncbi:MAG: TIGR04282 family arsenosugar biosynthesis glycosyltransferase [Myxococcales bacterium]